MKSEDGLRVLKAYGMRNWHNDVKLMLIWKLESGDIPAASKNDVGTVCSAYHHHGAENACYKSKVPLEPLVFDPELYENTASKPFLKPKKRAEATKPKRAPAQDKDRKDDIQHERRALVSKKNERDARIQKNLQELYNDGESEQPSSSDSEVLSEEEELNYHIIEVDSEYRKTREFFTNTPTHYVYHTDAYTNVPPKPTIAKRTLNILVDKEGRPLYKVDSLNVTNRRKSEADWKKMAIVHGPMQEFIDAGYSFVDIPIAVPEKYNIKEETRNSRI
jgi:hypothetical protein